KERTSVRSSSWSAVSSRSSPRPSWTRRSIPSGCGSATRPDARTVSGDLDHLLAHGIDHRFHARVQMQLLEDVADVVLDRVLRDVELLRDVPVVQALSDELEDLHLAFGQPRRGHLRSLLGR